MASTVISPGTVNTGSVVFHDNGNVDGALISEAVIYMTTRHPPILTSEPGWLNSNSMGGIGIHQGLGNDLIIDPIMSPFLRNLLGHPSPQKE